MSTLYRPTENVIIFTVFTEKVTPLSFANNFDKM